MSKEQKEIGLPFSIFKEQVNNDIKELLSPLPPNRIIAAPKYLINYIRRILDASLFGTVVKSLVTLDKVNPDNSQVVLIVITAAERTNVKDILDRFQNVPNYIKCLFLIPRNTALVQQEFTNRGLVAVTKPPTKLDTEIYVQEFHADFLPVDEDYFLLPCYHSFFQINAEKDFNDLYASARALAKIQTVFGAIPCVLTAGSAAKNVKDLMKGIMSQSGSLASQTPQVDSLIIFDRSIDIVTPLLTQSTFEGIIDEFFGINFGMCSIPDGKEITFSEKRSLISEMRGKLFYTVHDIISERVKEYKKISDPEYQASLRTANIEEFKKNILHLKKLGDEKDFFEAIQDLTEKMMFKAVNSPLFNSLRNSELDLIELKKYSAISTAEHFILLLDDWSTAMRLILLEAACGKTTSLNPELMNEFGDRAKETIRTLDRLHLICKQQADIYKNHYKIAEALELMKADDVKKMCGDVVPVAVRLAQRATLGEWPGSWGKTLAESKIQLTAEGDFPPPVEGKARRLIFFFVGGVTLSEVALLRLLGKQIFNERIQYVIGSTDQINSTSLTEQLCPGLFYDGI